MSIRRLTLPVLACATLTGMAALWTPGVRVVDGDTVDAGLFRYRLAGLDTPELRGRGACPETRERAQRAAERLRGLVAAAGGRWRLEPVPPYLDVWHSSHAPWLRRRVARLDIDGRDVAAILIAEGLARPYDGTTPRSWCE
jgi:micrococcal nuclease